MAKHIIKILVCRKYNCFFQTYLLCIKLALYHLKGSHSHVLIYKMISQESGKTLKINLMKIGCKIQSFPDNSMMQCFVLCFHIFTCSSNMKTRPIISSLSRDLNNKFSYFHFDTFFRETEEYFTYIYLCPLL